MKHVSWTEKDTFLKLIMDNIPQYIFWKDRNSVYKGCNMNFAKAAGLKDPIEIIGKTDYELPWSKEESDFYLATDQRVMASGKEELNFEESQTTANGNTMWLRTSKIPLRDSSGNVIGILGTYEDITLKKELEIELVNQSNALKKSNETLRYLNLSLERANIDLEQFAYATSHDLQEPLRMIGGFVTLLRKRYLKDLSQEALEYMEYISEGVKRMSSLIRGVLSYTKLEKEEEAFSEVLLSGIVTEKKKDLAVFLEDNCAAIHINLPSKPVLCQPVKIGILFYNLILNGLKFNHSERPEVSLNFEEKEQEWLFVVKDNGIGIAPEYMEKVFKPFKRLNNRQNFSGSGIGLSLCKRIVNLHNGKIWFESNGADGTTFFFTIPKNPLTSLAE